MTARAGDVPPLPDLGPSRSAPTRRRGPALLAGLAALAWVGGVWHLTDTMVACVVLPLQGVALLAGALCGPWWLVADLRARRPGPAAAGLGVGLLAVGPCLVPWATLAARRRVEAGGGSAAVTAAAAELIAAVAARPAQPGEQAPLPTVRRPDLPPALRALSGGGGAWVDPHAVRLHHYGLGDFHGFVVVQPGWRLASRGAVHLGDGVYWLGTDRGLDVVQDGVTAR